MHIHLHIHIRLRIHIHMHIQIQIHSCAHAHIQSHTRTHAHTRVSIHTYTHTHTQVHANTKHGLIHVIYTYTPICLYTCVCMHIFTLAKLGHACQDRLPCGHLPARHLGDAEGGRGGGGGECVPWAYPGRDRQPGSQWLPANQITSQTTSHPNPACQPTRLPTRQSTNPLLSKPAGLSCPADSVTMFIEATRNACPQIAI